MPTYPLKLSAIELIRLAQAKIKKSLGQHFLQSDAIIEKIIEKIPPQSHVLEIGPGAGVLSHPLAKKAVHLTLIEKDTSLKNHLEALFQDQSHVHLQWEDVLSSDLSMFNQAEKIYIVSNLPYNIGTAILTRLLKEISIPCELILMFQKEVADRIISETSKKSYGSLSVFCQSMAKIQKLTDVKPGCFLPPPDVNSTVLHFIPYYPRKLDPKQIIKLERVLQVCFQKRRKMLRQSLKSFHPNPEVLLDQIAPTTARPEELKLEQWHQIVARL